jgi:hypothetical protein
MPRPFPEEKRQEWKRLVEQWEATDQKISVARWCSEQNINYNNFLYWKERFRSGSVRRVDRSSFQELTHPPTTTGIILEYNQIRIQLTENFDAATLTKCLRILKEVAC